ncbi:unnamed protein product [Amaranthus hypochondriacus]
MNEEIYLIISYCDLPHNCGLVQFEFHLHFSKAYTSKACENLWTFNSNSPSNQYKDNFFCWLILYFEISGIRDLLKYLS